MSFQSVLIARFSGADGRTPLFLPDLRPWYRYHRHLGDLPERYVTWDLPAICRDLGLPTWYVVKPWRKHLVGLECREEKDPYQHMQRVETIAGPLIWRWCRTESGDWKQVEFPVKGPADLPAAVEWARALNYAIETKGLTEAEMTIGDGGLLAIETPPRPLVVIISQLLVPENRATLLREPAIEILVDLLEERLQSLIIALAQLATPIHYAPDALGCIGLSRELFEKYFLPSYRRTTEELQRYRKRLVVQGMGTIEHLLEGLIQAQVDVISDVPSPEGGFDALLRLYDQGRERITLWGGLAPTILLPETEAKVFEETIRTAGKIARDRGRLILGITGGVPGRADLERLRAIPALLETQ